MQGYPVISGSSAISLLSSIWSSAMLLLVRRSQRDDGWIATSMTFVLYAQLDLNREEEHLFDKYRLHDRVVYNSEPFLQHLEAADEHRAEIDRAHELMRDT